MSAISRLFEGGAKQLLPFITAGYPRLELTVDLALAAESAGVQLLELGVPFSDPIADGAVIQRASQTAISNGVTLDWALNAVASIKGQSQLALVMMGYFNPIMQLGPADFLSQAADAGVAGLIIPDLPADEGEDFYPQAREAGISPIMLLAPNISAKRITRLGGLSKDLLYAVSHLGVTGSAQITQKGQGEYLRRVRKNTAVPFVVGFGIRAAEDVARLSAQSDGVVVGSALLEVIGGAADPAKAAHLFLKNLMGALDRTSS